MALTFKDRVKQAVTTGGSGALVIGSASSGYQALAAGDDGKLFPYVIEDGTAWETGYGTYTHSGTSFARTLRTDSSTGSALTVTTSAFLFVDMVSSIATRMNIGAIGVAPGGRLTLESGVPVSTTDQTAKTTIYYTPYLSNVISLWDGSIWTPIEFAETSLALGTLTSGRPYDVFGYLSSGVLATELLAWTSDTARATAVTLQDGRYSKSGDKTRLYLGTFRTNSTTTTETSVNSCYVWNMYNRVARSLYIADAPTAFVYSTNTWRAFNAYTFASNPTKFCNFIIGLVTDAAIASVMSIADGDHFIAVWINGAPGSLDDRPRGTSTFRTNGLVESFFPALGLNSITVAQYGNGDANNWREARVNVKVLA